MQPRNRTSCDAVQTLLKIVRLLCITISVGRSRSVKNKGVPLREKQGGHLTSILCGAIIPKTHLLALNAGECY